MAEYIIRTHKGDPYDPLPTQLKFHQSDALCRSYIGYQAAGKSLCGSVEALRRAVRVPGYRPGKTLICREVMGDLESSTWATFTGVVKETCPQLIADEKRSTHELKLILKNGWVFTGRHLGRWQAFGSIEPDDIWIDECNDDGIDLKAYAMLRGRLDRGRFQKALWCTGNPAGKNWNYDLFFKAQLEGTKGYRGNEGFRPGPKENIHLPDSHWNELRAFYPEDWIKKFLDGSFDVYEGQILSEMNPDLHLIDDFEVPHEWPRYRGVDHGLNHPSTCVWIAIDPHGNRYAYREYSQSDAVPASNAERILAMSEREEEQVQWTMIDPSTAQRQTAGGQMQQIIDGYRDAGLNCRPGDNDMRASIALMKRLLQPDRTRVFPRHHWRAGDQGAPSLFITRGCRGLWNQLQLWRWKAVRPGGQERERPVDQNDDLVSAARYVLMSLPNVQVVTTVDPYAWIKKAIAERDNANSSGLESPLNYIGA